MQQAGRLEELYAKYRDRAAFVVVYIREAHAAEPLREQSIYIPYEKLRKVFEQHGRGVFLPDLNRD